MLNWFRRRRLLAALLIAVNPAFVGSWVAAYHPCPVRDGAVVRAAQEAAQLSADEHAGHEGMMMAEEAPAPPAHDHSGNDAPCSCIGQCLTAGIALPSFAGDEIRVAIEVTEHSAPGAWYALLPPASAPPYLLPPSTAPPIA